LPTFVHPGSDQDSGYGLSSGAIAGDHVWAAGMALDFDTMQREAAADTIAAETRICLDQIAAVLAEAGCTLTDVVKANCYLSDPAHAAEFKAAWDEALAPGSYPARAITVVGIACGCRVELDVTAVRPS
jgi:2-iminobutanoate/2-iminopropanoate deaminase